jgi:integrase
MATIQYRLSSRVSNGKAEVLARFYDGSVSMRAKTRIAVPVSFWDDKTGQLIAPRKISPETVEVRELQRTLDQLNDTICEEWWRERYNAGKNWLQDTIDHFHGIANNEEHANKQIRMADCVREYIATKELSHSTVLQYLFMANAIEEVEKKTHALFADCLTKDDVEAIAHYLTKGEGKERSRNTMSVKMKKLSAVCKYAVSRGYMQHSPFGDGGYKIQSEVYGTPTYLTIEERNQLYHFAGLTDKLAVQRDIFIFQCHIGCRVSDLIELTQDNITEDGFLQYIQHKTRRENPVVVRVPLSDTAMEIIRRYKECAGEKLLPFINTQDYNDCIHDIFRIAGLKRNVMVQDPVTLKSVSKPLWKVATSHIARRTFMANMFKETKSERITSAFTGHATGSRAFTRYTEVDDEMKRNVLKTMNELQ